MMPLDQPCTITGLRTAQSFTSTQYSQEQMATN